MSDENETKYAATRNRTAEYIAIADQIPRQPGKCTREGCGLDLVGFCAGDTDDTNHNTIFESIRAWFRFGCPKHDIYVFEWLDDVSGLAALRHRSDPVWEWAPTVWRKAVSVCGWGLPSMLSFPTLLFGEHGGYAWVTDRKTMLRLPAEDTLKTAEERGGLTVHAKTPEEVATRTEALRAQYRLTSAQLAPHLDLDGYVAAPAAAAPSSLGLAAERWDPNYIALGAAVVPRHLIAMVSELYPSCSWLVRGKVEAVMAVDAVDDIVAVVMPADCAAVDSEGAQRPGAPAEATASAATGIQA